MLHRYPDNGAIAAILFVLSMETLLFLPKGELLCISVSPSGDRSVGAYLCDGGATVDCAVRCEASGKGLIRRNIYWQYHEPEAVVHWLDNDTVRINGILLDVKTGRYDYRKTEVP